MLDFVPQRITCVSQLCQLAACMSLHRSCWRIQRDQSARTQMTRS
ncbi:hypothetical protein DAI22_11g128950 [Oryza sativa Japonica Group]|nr:hypothetical protein DAI22_11g128950 [Oryza sativa Japonica Group]